MNIKKIIIMEHEYRSDPQEESRGKFLWEQLEALEQPGPRAATGRGDQRGPEQCDLVLA